MDAQHVERRRFLQTSAAVAAGMALARPESLRLIAAEPTSPFKLSVGEWTFVRPLFGKTMKHFDVAKVIKQQCGIDGIEYSAQFFMDKPEDVKYLDELKKHAMDEGVTPVLITVDRPGKLGDPDEKKRTEAVEDHQKWVTAGKHLGCPTIRVNAHSDESLPPDEQAKLVADGLRRLVEFGAKHDINVIVENHGGISGDAAWLTKVVKLVDLPHCGTLPDFGNFPREEGVDRYRGVEEMMPFAKGVSAKSYAFDEQGNETTIDYHKMLKIVYDAGFRGYIGIEYEGDKMSEVEGTLATKRLIETIQAELA